MAVRGGAGVDKDDNDVDVRDIGLSGDDFEAVLDQLGQGRAGRTGSTATADDIGDILDWETEAVSRAGPATTGAAVKTSSVSTTVRGNGLLIPRPQLFIRLILLTLMLLLGLLAVGGALVADAAADLVVTIKDQEGRQAEIIAEPDPSATQVLDEGVFARLTVERPEGRARLWVLRAQALAEAGRYDEAINGYRIARLESAGEFGVDERLAYAEVLIAAKHLNEAQAELRSLNLTELDVESRQQVLDLLGRIGFASNRR